MHTSNARRPIRRAITAVAVAAVATLAVAAPATAAPTATITAGAYDFGNRQVSGGVSAAKTYTVTATGAEDVAVQTVTLQGADAAQFVLSTDTCTGATLNGAGTVKTCMIGVRFSPTSTGAKSTTVRVVAGGGLTLTSGAISAHGRDLAFSPSVLDFGAALAGTSSTEKTVTITNRDSAPYTLGTVAVAPTNQAQWSVSSTTCTAALAPNASCTVGVTFRPAGSTGTKNSTLAIGPASGAGSYGPAPVTLLGQAGQPAIAVGPATHVFDERAVGVGPSAPREISVTNTGNLPLVIGPTELRKGDGPNGDPHQFAIGADGCAHTTVAPGATCTVEATFAPTSAGWHSATLRLTTNAALPDAHVALAGRGVGAIIDPPLTRTAVDLLTLPVSRFDGDGNDGASTIAGGRCDLTGSGHSDLLIGAPLWSTSPTTNSWEGAVYVVPGGSSFGSADLADRSRVKIIEGERSVATQAAGNQTGSVACADVNGDGLDDLVIGAWAYQYPGRLPGTRAARGAAYVVFGAKDFFGLPSPDLSNLGRRGFRIEGGDGGLTTTGPDEQDHLGYAVANVGDLNSDGKDDIAVMANTGATTTAVPPRTSNGLVFVIAGRDATQTVDVTDPAQTLLRINGASPGSTAAPFGQMSAVAGIGDVNGDGRPDIGIGTYTAVTFGRSTASGAAFAVSGAARGDIDLARSDDYLFAVGGAFAGHRLGISIAGAGDVNGDGLDDLVIGADSTSAANTSAAYVVYGSRTPTAGAVSQGILDSADLGLRGYRLIGPAGARTGYAVDGAGDVNGDGLDDLLIGSYGNAGPAGASTGTAWVAYGVADPTTLPQNDAASTLTPANANDRTRYQLLAGLSPAQGSRLDGLTAGERFGRTLARVDDLTGPGGTGLAVGSDMAFRLGRSGGGEVSVTLLPGAPIPARAPDPDPPTTTTTTPTTTTPAPGPTLVAPVHGTTPSIAGRAAVGSTLTCAPGRWTGTPDPTLAYAWQRDGVPIAGARGATYVTRPADVASAITCAVTATNAAGTRTVPGAGAVTVTRPATRTATATTAQAGPSILRLLRAVRPSTRTGAATLGTVRCVRAAATTCTAKLRVRTKVGGRTTTVRGSVTVAQGKTRTLRVVLPKAVRAALARRSGTVATTVHVTDDRQLAGSRTQAATLTRS